MPPLVPRTTAGSGKRNLHLWAEGDLVVEGRKRKEVYFAGLSTQKGYVGFYFQPVYVAPGRADELVAPELLGILKGKSCFHVRTLDGELLGQIEDALARGLDLYRERAWVR